MFNICKKAYYCRKDDLNDSIPIVNLYINRSESKTYYNFVSLISTSNAMYFNTKLESR